MNYQKRIILKKIDFTEYYILIFENLKILFLLLNAK